MQKERIYTIEVPLHKGKLILGGGEDYARLFADRWDYTREGLCPGELISERAYTREGL